MSTSDKLVIRFKFHSLKISSAVIQILLATIILSISESVSSEYSLKFKSVIFIQRLFFNSN